VRSEGRGCDAHQYLGYPCGHVFLTCCEEEEEKEEQEGTRQIPLTRKQKPRPTSRPRKGTRLPPHSSVLQIWEAQFLVLIGVVC